MSIPQVGIGSESYCLFGQLETSDSEAGVKTEKLGGVAEGEGECGDDVAGWLVRERRSLDILPVKKEAKLSARSRTMQKICVTSTAACYSYQKRVLLQPPTTQTSLANSQQTPTPQILLTASHHFSWHFKFF